MSKDITFTFIASPTDTEIKSCLFGILPRLTLEGIGTKLEGTGLNYEPLKDEKQDTWNDYLNDKP